MTWDLAVGIFFVIFATTIVVIKLMVTQKRHWLPLDFPNERSSHVTPTPKGGGLGVLVVFFLSILLLGIFNKISQGLANQISILTLFLAIVSWIDDFHDLNPAFRLATHVSCISAAIYLGLVDGPIFGGFLPPLIDKLLTGIAWVWFINLFNFMDGIDGIIGVETLAIGLGVLIIGVSNDLGYMSLVLSALSSGFLILNWHPAKIFLGDVGSVPIGFLLGWVLLSVASEGYWLAALILPSYFLIDTGLTLIRRLIRRQKFWKAHREHFYQYATQHGRSHSEVSCAIALANTLLIAFALITTKGVLLFGVVGALIVVACLIFWMLDSSHVISAGKNKE